MIVNAIKGDISSPTCLTMSGKCYQGFDSVMVDGSHLPFEGNIVYTKFIADLAHQKNICVEAELGRLSGTEDELTVEEYEARFTDINQVGVLINSLNFLSTFALSIWLIY